MIKVRATKPAEIFESFNTKSTIIGNATYCGDIIKDIVELMECFKYKNGCLTINSSICIQTKDPIISDVLSVWRETIINQYCDNVSERVYGKAIIEDENHKLHALHFYPMEIELVDDTPHVSFSAFLVPN